MMSPQELVFEKQTLAASRIKGHGNLPESSTMSHKHLLNELTWLVQRTIRSWFLVQRSCVPGSNCLTVAHMYILAGRVLRSYVSRESSWTTAYLLRRISTFYNKPIILETVVDVHDLWNIEQEQKCPFSSFNSYVT